MPLSKVQTISTNFDYERSGLRFLIKCFKFWSIDLESEPKPRFSKIYVGLVVLLFISYTIKWVINVTQFWFIDEISQYDDLCVYLLILISWSSGFFTFLSTLRALSSVRALFRGLTVAVLAIPEPSVRQKCVKHFRILSIFSAVSPIFSCGFVVVGTAFIQKFWPIFETNYYQLSAKQILAQLLNIIQTFWIMTMGSFYFFSNLLVVVVSKMLTTLTSVYLDPKVEEKRELWEESADPQNLSEKMIKLQKISRLILAANECFSNFMLISLCFESVIAVVILKVLGKLNVFNRYLNCIQITLFIFKVYFAGNVNSKFESSLTRRDVVNSIKDLATCSAEQIRFNCYLNEQMINRAQMTYGNLFAIKKTFIFTIAGTALTYALLVNGIPATATSLP